MLARTPRHGLGSLDSRDFFSARIGCQTYSPAFGMDLAQLCIKR